MTADRATATRTVVLRRAEHAWPPGYFHTLLGLGLRIPALIEHGRVLAGYLVGVEETEDTIALTFGELDFE